MKDIALADAVTAKPAGIKIFFDLQDTPLDIPAITTQESLDIIAINWKATLPAPGLADGP